MNANEKLLALADEMEVEADAHASGANDVDPLNEALRLTSAAVKRDCAQRIRALATPPESTQTVESPGMTDGEVADKLQDYLDFVKEHDPTPWPRGINPHIAHAICRLRNPPVQRLLSYEGVTDAIVDRALTAYYGEQFADLSGKADARYRELMRSALTAALHTTTTDKTVGDHE